MNAPNHRLPTHQVPPGKRIYAIGDIHGRHDLLSELHARILDDAASASHLLPTVVYLGDYVDRGPGSFEVIETLLHAPLAGFERVHLKGNHEDMMLKFLAERPDPNWLFNGGTETLASYGVTLFSWLIDFWKLEDLQKRLRESLPADHRRFLESLCLRHTEGDYGFVHAGVRPGAPLDAQDARDLMWIRGPFLNSNIDFGKRIVHGHTINPAPVVRPNRIGIDTGAFFTGHLTCLVLENAGHRFLST